MSQLDGIFICVAIVLLSVIFCVCQAQGVNMMSWFFRPLPYLVICVLSVVIELCKQWHCCDGVEASLVTRPVPKEPVLVIGLVRCVKKRRGCMSLV